MAASGTPKPQEVLSDYWVGKLLGTGARSQVYEVKRKSDGRLFAAKFLAVRSKEDLKVIGHLENEYSVLQKLHEPKTQASELVVHPEEFRKLKGLFKIRGAYLVMERVYGKSLDEYRDYDVADILAIFRQACLALDHMHQRGYVHADLKPQNILVDEMKIIKMIDFGFAAPVGMELSSLKGTLGFIAPEQAGGRLTEKTDVYNLGAALYWVLTGQNIPSIMPDQHNSVGFVADENIRIQPPHMLNPDIPKELSEAVVQCCSPKEHTRPSVKQLRRYLHGLALRMDMGAYE
jgi:serine/threonine-protein kinase